MTTVHIRVPVDAPYPHDAIRAGLTAAGCRVVKDHEADLLVVWAPWIGSKRHALQQRFAARGRPVIVVENGWLSPIRGEPYYQIAFDDWNTGEGFPGGPGGRWMQWRIDLAPWRTDGEHILVVGQRGHYIDRRSMPPGWLDSAMKVLRELITDRPLIARPHGEGARLEDQLAGAHAVHVWTSNASAHAIIAGVPVFYMGPTIMCHRLARYGFDFEHPALPYRPPELERLAYAQWNAGEIASGRPFKRLLEWRPT